ncbi:unnamed protein product [Medioppia subpectinata]|uniref:Uncharacterized protein n=1 Tax=Medioppia subpectinata TaxID=1979941 RepID=A0A7R9KNV5_9ACAR|nr:unnamed protein product [Medioppia subpectinata]CAG2107038.1 unnamed protein product [Medioppia subpectinata]
MSDIESWDQMLPTLRSVSASRCLLWTKFLKVLSRRVR